MMSPATANTCPLLLRLAVHSPDGAVFHHELEQEHVLIVGSNAACGLRLDSRDVAGMHCSIESSDAGIKIRDWSSDGGTFVDGCRVDEELMMQPGAEIQIADFRIVTRSLSGTTVPGTASDAVNQPSAILIENETDHSPSEADTRPPTAESALSIEAHSEHQWSTAEASNEERQASDPEWNRDFDPWDSLDDVDVPGTVNSLETAEQTPGAASSYERGAFADDAGELLQAEVEFLRAELAERDARLREFEELAPFDAEPSQPQETISAKEAEVLVGRLEQLLVELEESDEQVSTLTELLRTSDEAVEAADEERQQMETWIGEVERRVGQYQDEWRGERERLQKDIAEVTEQRDRAEHQLASGQAGGSSSTARDELLEQIRQEYSLLKSKYLETEQERNQLQSRFEESRVTDVEQRIATAVDEALREERLHLAQEKATIARVKSELTKKHEDLESRLKRKQGDGDSADLRIRAFREHLREIHENEPQRPHVPTFSDRMSKLWRKLEGKPLDTD